jgi:hypothetical protein
MTGEMSNVQENMTHNKNMSHINKKYVTYMKKIT